MHIKVYAALILLTLALLFAVQNAAPVQVRFLFWGFSSSLAVLMVLLLGIGLLAGWIMGRLLNRRTPS